MQIKITLVSVVAACSATVSAGYAQVFNLCPFPVYLWSATPTSTSQEHTLAAGNGFYEEEYQALPTGGVALKLSLFNDIAALYNGSALTQDQYTLDGALVWYSLADTAGDPFLGNQIALVPSRSGESIVWPNGQGPSQVLNTDSANNLSLLLCV